MNTKTIELLDRLHVRRTPFDLSRFVAGEPAINRNKDCLVECISFEPEIGQGQIVCRYIAIESKRPTRILVMPIRGQESPDREYSWDLFMPAFGPEIVGPKQTEKLAAEQPIVLTSKSKRPATKPVA